MDRRIGENDNNMSYEEKMLARFQKTRQVCYIQYMASDRDQIAPVYKFRLILLV